MSRENVTRVVDAIDAVIVNAIVADEITYQEAAAVALKLAGVLVRKAGIPRDEAIFALKVAAPRGHGDRTPRATQTAQETP